MSLAPPGLPSDDSPMSWYDDGRRRADNPDRAGGGERRGRAPRRRHAGKVPEEAPELPDTERDSPFPE